MPRATNTALCLGFDLRVASAERRDWTTDRKWRFLIRPEVDAPLSVDHDVWPSMMRTSDNPYPFSLWRSVTHLVNEHARQVEKRTASRPLIIRIDVVVDKLCQRQWENLLYGWPHPEEDDNLVLIRQECGFDVADEHLVSGLSNCMLSPRELAELRAEWSSRVNDLGLLINEDDAATFRAICDRLIPEHAPFFTYRIERIDIKGDLDQPPLTPFR